MQLHRPAGQRHSISAYAQSVVETWQLVASAGRAAGHVATAASSWDEGTAASVRPALASPAVTLLGGALGRSPSSGSLSAQAARPRTTMAMARCVGCMPFMPATRPRLHGRHQKAGPHSVG